VKEIFIKNSFPKAPGGDRYEWKEVETGFHLAGRGFFAIKIDASAKNARQNGSKDDDDLRVAIDGFDFGKYERHQEMASWKGFGAGASWDGASFKIEYFDNEEFLERLKKIVDLRKYVLHRAHLAINIFQWTKNKYSAQFLNHALEKNPKPLIFQTHDPLIKEMRRDPVYKKIIVQLKKKISAGILNGEIWPDDFNNQHMDFNSHDLKYALHGIKKIEYVASVLKPHTYKIIMTFFDVYDFSKMNIPQSIWPVNDFLKAIINNALDRGETIDVIKNYEIEIHVNETLYIH